MFADVAAVISCSAVKVRCLHGTAIDNSAAAGQHARAQARLRGWQLRAALVRMPRAHARIGWHWLAGRRRCRLLPRRATRLTVPSTTKASSSTTPRCVWMCAWGCVWAWRYALGHVGACGCMCGGMCGGMVACWGPTSGSASLTAAAATHALKAAVRRAAGAQLNRATRITRTVCVQIVGDTPEAVEYRGLQHLMGAVAERLGYEDGKVRQAGRGRLGGAGLGCWGVGCWLRGGPAFWPAGVLTGVLRCWPRCSAGAAGC